MAFSVMGSDKSIHRVWPDPYIEIGLVPIRKQHNIQQGGWDVMYGDTVLKHCADESTADGVLDDIKDEMNNVRESGSCVTVAEIDALS